MPERTPSSCLTGVVEIATDGAPVRVRVTRRPGEPPALDMEGRGGTCGLVLRARRAAGPTPGVEVEVLRTLLFGDESSCGLALLPDDGAAPRWLRAPERSDAGRVLVGLVEALTAGTLPQKVALPALPAPRAVVEKTSGWADVVAPNGLPGGLPEGEEPSDVQRALGGAWSVTLDAAPSLPLEARLWFQHRQRDGGGDVVLLTASWGGPGTDSPWHVELHVTHHAEDGTVEFLAIDGSTEEAWVLADAVYAAGLPLTWRVHPAPQPDEATRTGEAPFALITALAGVCPV